MAKPHVCDRIQLANCHLVTSELPLTPVTPVLHPRQQFAFGASFPSKTLVLGASKRYD